MPPKNKVKKGKKGGDDDFGDKNSGGLAVPLDIGSEEDRPVPKSKISFSALQMEDPVAPEEEEEDFGGLMSAIKATTKAKKDKKKPKKSSTADLDVDGETPDNVDQDGEPSAVKSALVVNADDMDDDEWGPVKEKKSKKAKTDKAKPSADATDEPTPEDAATGTTPTTDPKADDAGDDETTGEPKVLSKKEKEKLKKDREKAKKKAQAAAKKAEDAPQPTETAATPVAPAPVSEPPKANGPADDEEDGAAGASSSKKKKKKKAGAKEDGAPAAAAVPAKKGKISALKAMMDEKKRLDEEARLAAEKERLRIEEEERLAEEMEKKKEEERLAKKEREKAKREIAKKEGRLLTKKQQADKTAAELRRKALIASGVTIEGLQQESSSAAPSGPKKVVYGNRKKKGPAQAQASPAISSRPLSPEPAIEASSKPPDDDDGVKSDWDASSGDEAPPAPAADVKDSWDAPSEEELEAPTSTPAPSMPAVAPAKGEPPRKSLAVPASKSAPTKVAVPKTTVPPNGKPKPNPQNRKPVPEAEEESSEEEEDESGSSSGSGDSDGSGSDDSDDSDEESSEEELTAAQKMAAQRKAEAAERRAKAHEAAMAARSKDDLRSPICCILGHVDTGKTKLLDKIRQTNVQEGEAGGITQQIGATFFPVDAIKMKTAVLNKDGSQEYKIPGLLVIDTPGHESFTNLRTRGSSLCNIAILVVDIMHGLEPQTLESLRLLRDRKTPFVVALNKIDRIYGWDPTPDGGFQESLARQKSFVQREFADRVEKTRVAFAEQGLNSILYYENKNFAKNVSLVPTSAITGEGIPDMIMLLVNLTQQRMNESLMYLSELQCTVLEVKVIEGLGTTIDVVLSNGILREGDKIVVCGLNGPIVTQVRALLTPQPLRELRIKSVYVHHKEVKAALGVKITAPDLEKAIAGSRLLVCGPDDDEDDLREEVMSDLTSLLNSIDKSGRGVCVQASTLGSLEALLDFLKSSKIPVSGINIGPVHKKDIMRAATMLEKAKELSCILCFDVPIDKEAEKLADDMGIRLFKADIIYHLFDAFTAYNAEIVEAKRKDAAPAAVWPCRLKIIAAFCKRDPIILGVDILDGTLRVGTPICVVKVDPTTQKKEIIDLGKVTSLEINHKTFEIVKKSQAAGGVAVKIEHAVYQSAKMFGRHFEEKDVLMSHITRVSIDTLKNTFKDDVSKEEWQLIKGLKPLLNIQ